jgi:mono/diheme cytochrome c family protein
MNFLESIIVKTTAATVLHYLSAIAVLLSTPTTFFSSHAAEVASLNDVKEILTTHCIRCHGPKEQQGELRLDTLTSDFSNSQNAATWIEVRDRINLGEMPPEGEPKLPLNQLQKTTEWIASGLRDAERDQLAGDGRVLLRRMNRHEYTNTVSDLLHLKFPSGESPLDSLPPDGTAEGFDKVSAALLLDPSLMELYYQLAARIAERAIVDGPPEYPTERMRLEFEDIPASNAIGYLVTRRGMQPVEGGLQIVEGSTRSFGMLKYPGEKGNNVAPVNGFYRFTIRAGGSKGSNGEIPRIRLTQSHPDDKMRLVLEADVNATWDKPELISVVIPRDTLGGELQVSLVNETKLNMGQRPGEDFMRRSGELGRAEEYQETIRLAGRKIAEGWGGERSTPDPEKLDVTKYPRVFLDYLEVEGPLYDQWPPQSHQELLFKRNDAKQDMAYAKEIFARFLPRAWRRPIADRELEPVLKAVQTELDAGEDFHEAIRVGLTVVLTSPKFLYILEPAFTEEVRPLNEYEFASRLSYFLWSSMPDEELFKLAAEGKLSQTRILSMQVDRMLSDPKAARFVSGFGRQWLQTDTFLSFTPDKYLYKEYDEKLATAVVQEPLEFMRLILEKDLSALNFIDSEFAVLNQRLADHYGIEGVRGEEFRRVELPENSQRGGLLAMAGVHQAGSDGVRTKPVSRAVYVRDVLFNDPPNPPPPNAGEIEPNIQGENLTVRDRLIQHQKIESCAACHRSLDPYGLALENFNVIGHWRDVQDGENFRGKNSPPIVASGTLPNGKDYENFSEFRQLLRAQEDRFRRGLAEKMFIYALGRPVQPADDVTLAAATTAMAENGDTFRALIKSLVRSKVFGQK